LRWKRAAAGAGRGYCTVKLVAPVPLTLPVVAVDVTCHTPRFSQLVMR
jgi:hypothetical protein